MDPITLGSFLYPIGKSIYDRLVGASEKDSASGNAGPSDFISAVSWIYNSTLRSLQSPPLSREALPPPDQLPEELDRARLLMVRVKNGDLTEGKLQGHLEFYYTLDDKGEKVKEYAVLFVPTGSADPQVWYSSNNKPTTTEGHDAIRDALERYLYDASLLGKYQARKEPGKLDPELILPFGNFAATDETQLFASLTKLDKDLASKLESARKARDKYLAVSDQAAIDAFSTADTALLPVETDPLSSLAKGALDKLSNLREALATAIAQLPTAEQFNKLSPEKQAEVNRYRKEWGDHLQAIKLELSVLLPSVMGEKGQRMDELDLLLNGKWEELAKLEKPENGYLALYEDLKEARLAYDRYFKNKDNYEISKAKDHREEAERYRKEAIAAYNQAIDKLIEVFARLNAYEQNLFWVPGVKERCIELRQRLAGFAEMLNLHYPKDNESSADMDVKANTLAQYAGNIKIDAAPEAGAKDPVVVRAQHETAARVSEILDDNAGREIVISFFYSIADDERVPFSDAFSEMRKVIEGLSDEQLQALGKYLQLRSQLKARGVEDKDIDDNPSIKALKFGAAKLALDALEKWQTTLRQKADAEKDPTKRVALQNKHEALVNLVYNFILVFYKNQKSYNVWAASQGKPPCTFEKAVELAEKAAAIFPPETKKETFRVIFGILGKVSQEAGKAREEIAQLLFDSINKIMLEKATGSASFVAAAKEIALTPVLVAALERKAGERSLDLPPQVFKGEDLMAYPAFKGLKADSYYLVNLRTSETTEIASPSAKAIVPEESTVGGSQDERTTEELLPKEKIAVIKLFITGRGFPTSDYLHLVKVGTIIARLTSVDLTTMITLFARGRHYFPPNVLQFDINQRSVLEKIIKEGREQLGDANIDLLKKLLYDPMPYFSDDEKTALILLLSQLPNYQFNFLHQSARPFVIAAAEAGLRAVGKMHFKDGLNEKEVEVLRAAAVYMQENGLEITEHRLIGDLLPGFSQNQALSTILNKIHYQIQNMASKNPPEEKEFGNWWEGYKDYIQKTVHHAVKSVRAAGVDFFQTVGLMQDQILEFNLWLLPDGGLEVATRVKTKSVEKTETAAKIKEVTIAIKEKLASLFSAFKSINEAVKAVKAQVKAKREEAQRAIAAWEQELKARNSQRYETYMRVKGELETLEETYRTWKQGLPKDQAEKLDAMEREIGELNRRLARIQEENRARFSDEIDKLENELDEVNRQIDEMQTKPPADDDTAIDAQQTEDAALRGLMAKRNRLQKQLEEILYGKKGTEGGDLYKKREKKQKALKEFLEGLTLSSGKYAGKSAFKLQEDIEKKQTTLDRIRGKDLADKERERIGKEISRLQAVYSGWEKGATEGDKATAARLKSEIETLSRQLFDLQTKNEDAHLERLDALDREIEGLYKAINAKNNILKNPDESDDSKEDTRREISGLEKTLASKIREKWRLKLGEKGFNLRDRLNQKCAELDRLTGKAMVGTGLKMLARLQRRLGEAAQATVKNRERDLKKLDEQLTELESFLNDSYFKSLQDMVENAGRDPQASLQLLVSLEDLQKQVVAFEAKLKGGEDAFGKALSDDLLKPAWAKMLVSLRLVFGETFADSEKAPAEGGLSAQLIQLRERLLQLTEARLKTDSELQLTLDDLFSDKFDAKKLETLKAKLEGIYGKDWKAQLYQAVSNLLLEKMRVYGIDGRDLGNPMDILEAYLKTHPHLSLSSTLPHVGEDIETTIAKIALTVIYSRLAQEQTLSAGTVLSTLVLGHHNPLSVPVATLLDEAGLEVEFGPETAADLSEVTSDPVSKALYDLYSYAALSSDRHPPMNISSQLHYALKQTKSGQEYIATVTQRARAHEAAFKSVRREDLVAFLKCLKEEIIPLIQGNPELKARLRTLLAEHKLRSQLFYVVLSDNPKDKDIEATLAALDPQKLPETFKLYDGYHADEKVPGSSQLAYAVEDFNRISTEINRSTAIPDYREEPIQYFVPGERVNELQGKETAPVPEKFTVGYVEEGKTGFEAVPWYISNFIYNGVDFTDWFSVHGRKFTEDMRQLDYGDISTYVDGVLHFGEGFGESFVKFDVMMPFQIGAGLLGMGSDLLDFSGAIFSWDIEKARAAMNNFKRNMSETAGSFVVFETLPFIFFEEALNDFEQDHYAAALGKMLFIYYQSKLQLKAHIAAFKWAGKGIGKGGYNVAAWIHNRFVEDITRTWDYKRFGPLPTEFAQAIKGGVGTRMVYYTTFGLPHGAYKVAKAVGGAAAAVASAPGDVLHYWSFDPATGQATEIRPEEYELRVADRSSKFGGFGNRVQQARYYAGLAIRFPFSKPAQAFKHVFGDILRRTAEMAVRRRGTTGHALQSGDLEALVRGGVETLREIQRANITPEEAKAILRNAIRNPEGSTEIRMLSRSKLRKYLALARELENPNLKPESKAKIIRQMNLLQSQLVETVIIRNDALLELARTGEADWRRSRHIGERNNARVGKAGQYRLGHGSWREFHATFSPFRDALNNPADPDFKASLQARRRTPVGPDARTALRVAREIRSGKGLLWNYSLKNPVTGKEIIVTGKDIQKIMAGQQPEHLPPEDAQAVRKYFTERLPQVELQGIQHAGQYSTPETAGQEVARKALPKLLPAQDVAFMSWRDIYFHFKKRDRIPDGKSPAAKEGAASAKATYAKYEAARVRALQRIVFDIATANGGPYVMTADGSVYVSPLSPEEKTAARQRSYLTKKQFTRVFKGARHEVQAKLRSFEIAERERVRLQINPPAPSIVPETPPIPPTAPSPAPEPPAPTPPAAPEPARPTPAPAPPTPAPSAPAQPAVPAPTPVSPKIVQLMKKYNLTEEQATKAWKLIRDYTAQIKQARARALNGIDSLPKTLAERATMKKVAARSWKAELARVEKFAVEKARPSAPSAAARTFFKNHGLMLGFIFAFDLVKHYKSVLKGDFKDLAEQGAVTMGGYVAFSVAKSSLQRFFELTEGKAVPVTGAVIAGLAAAYQHRNHLQSSNLTTTAAAILDVGKEAGLGYFSAEIGMNAAKLFAPRIGLWSIPVGIIVGAAVYAGGDAALDALGYGAWIEKACEEGDIVDGLRDINRGWGKTRVKIENDATDIPYFTAATIQTKEGFKITQAKQTLAILESAKAYANKTEAEKRELEKDTNNAPILQAFSTFQQIKLLTVDNYSTLTPEALDKIAEAVAHFGSDAAPGERYQDLTVSLSSREETITHPITGEVVGTYRIYTVKVRGYKFENVARANYMGWAPKDGTYKATTLIGNGNVDIQSPSFGEAGYLLEKAQKNEKGEIVSFDLSKEEMLANKIDIPFEKLHLFPQIALTDENGKIIGYNLTLQDLALNGIDIPFHKLNQYPIAMEQLNTALKALGYDTGSGSADDLKVAYNSYAYDQVLHAVRTKAGPSVISGLPTDTTFVPHLNNLTLSAAIAAEIIYQIAPDPVVGFLVSGLPLSFDSLPLSPELMEQIAASLSKLGYEIADPTSPADILSAYALFCANQKMPLEGFVLDGNPKGVRLMEPEDNPLFSALNPPADKNPLLALGIKAKPVYFIPQGHMRPLEISGQKIAEVPTVQIEPTRLARLFLIADATTL